MDSLYRQFRPESGLRHMVDAYWINQQRPPHGGPLPAFDRVFPHGCIDLIFQSHGHGHGDRGSAPRLFVSALIEEPLPLAVPSNVWFVGVRFRPGMSRVVLNVAPEECRNGELDATLVEASFSALQQQLVDCSTPEEALDGLRRNVDQRLAANAQRAAPPRIRRALSLLREIVPEAGSIATVAEALGVTGRTLHRDLAQWTGHAPKVLVRIFRMQAALHSLRAGQSSLAAVSAESGYADQSHMTREFRRLTGATPAEYCTPS